MAAHVSTAGSRSFYHTPFCVGHRRILAWSRSATFNSIVDLRRACCCAKRLDRLLGRLRLVRRARRVHVAPMGMVGSRTRTGPPTNEMAVPLARALRLSARDRRFSLHGFDVVAAHCMALDQDLGSNPKHLLRAA